MKQIALANLLVVSAIILVRSMRGATRRVNQSNEASTVAVEKHVFERRRAEWRRGWDRNHDYLWRGHLCRFTDGRWIIFETGFYPEDYYPNCETGANCDQSRHVGVQSRECLSKNRHPLLLTQRAASTRHES